MNRIAPAAKSALDLALGFAATAKFLVVITDDLGNSIHVPARDEAERDDAVAEAWLSPRTTAVTAARLR